MLCLNDLHTDHLLEPEAVKPRYPCAQRRQETLTIWHSGINPCEARPFPFLSAVKQSTAMAINYSNRYFLAPLTCPCAPLRNLGLGAYEQCPQMVYMICMKGPNP
jgi:hypothetical protein